MRYAAAAVRLQAERWDWLLRTFHATQPFPDFLSTDLDLTPNRDPLRHLDALAARPADLRRGFATLMRLWAKLK